MSQMVVERVLGRLVTDEKFRRCAAESLEKICHQEGYLLTPSEIELLSGLELTKISELSDDLNPGLRRASIASSECR